MTNDLILSAEVFFFRHAEHEGQNKIRQAILQIRAARPLHKPKKPAQICSIPKSYLNNGGGTRIRTGDAIVTIFIY
jgi:hypothetical protein